MPQTPHTERHFTGIETVRDIVIGMSDGLTDPFALAAGKAGRYGSPRHHSGDRVPVLRKNIVRAR